MAIANWEKVLVKCFAHVWGQNEVILIFLVDIVDTKSFPGGVGKSCYNILIYNLGFSILVEPFYFERVLSCVLNAVVVIDALLGEVHVLTQSSTSRSRCCINLRTTSQILWHLHHRRRTCWNRPFSIEVHRRAQCCRWSLLSCCWRVWADFNDMQLVQRVVQQHFLVLSLTRTRWSFKLAWCKWAYCLRWTWLHQLWSVPAIWNPLIVKWLVLDNIKLGWALVPCIELRVLHRLLGLLWRMLLILWLWAWLLLAYLLLGSCKLRRQLCWHPRDIAVQVVVD